MLATMLHFIGRMSPLLCSRLVLLWTVACFAACSPNPSPQEQALTSGNQALAALQLAQAEEHFSQAIDLDSSLVSAYVGRAQVRYVQQQFEQAIEDLNAAISLDPELGTAYFLRGLSLFATGMLEQALPDLEQAGASESIELQDRVRAHRMRAVLYMNTLQYTEGIGALSDAVALEPDDVALYYERGLLYARVGEAGAAVTDLERYIEAQADTTAGRIDVALLSQARQTLDSLRATLR